MAMLRSRAVAKQSQSETTEESEVKTKLEDDLSALCIALKKMGYKVPLTDIAGWDVSQKQKAASFAEGNEEQVPIFISKYEVTLKETLEEPPEMRASLLRTTPSSSPTPAKGEELSLSIGHVVSATWGEEKYTPIAGSYSTCSVGPFYACSPVRLGETTDQAAARLHTKLAEYAEAERDRKLKSFVAKLKGVVQESKS